MGCLEKIENSIYPNDLVMDLTKLYQFKGKDFYYEEVLKQHLNGLVSCTIAKDVYFFSKILGLDVNDNRMKLLVKKDSNPKTKDEHVVKNLKEIFTLIQAKGEGIELTTNEFIQLASRMFKNYKRVDYKEDTVRVQENILMVDKKVFRRKFLENELNVYAKMLETKKAEITLLCTKFYIDILNLDLYTDFNSEISLLILYCLLYRERFNVFKYVSFFEKYYENFEEFKSLEAKSSLNWDTGYNKTDALNNKIIEILLESYMEVEKMVQDTDFDKNLKKIDNVKSAILRLPQTFTKADIKRQFGHISESTLNRALDELKKENKIVSNGTGRSATWNRIVSSEIFNTKTRQMTLFELEEGNED